MRIFSWNMQGKHIQPERLRHALNELEADALVAQEPAEPPIDIGATGTSRRIAKEFPLADRHRWKSKAVKAANKNGQDRYWVAWNADVLDEPTVTVAPDPTDVGGLDNRSRQYAIVTFTGRGQTVKVATAHAPYIVSDREHTESYMQTVLEELKTKVDLFMGDTNLEADSQIESTVLGMETTLASPSTNGKDSNPFDRIFAFSTEAKDSKVRAGRVLSGANKRKSQSSKDRRSGKVIDLDPKAEKVWDQADHFAIYVDTDPTVANSRDSPANVGSRGGEELFELDERGKPRKIKRKDTTTLDESAVKKGKIEENTKEEMQD